MRARLKYSRLFPVPGLAVMVAAAMVAARYTPDWFDVSDTCVSRSPCFSETESASALHTLDGVVFAGLLLTMLGIAACAWVLSSAPRSTPLDPRAATHAGLSGVAAGFAAMGGLFAGFMASLAASGELGIAVVTIAWLVLAVALEGLDRAFGCVRGAAAAYLLSLGAALVGMVVLGGTATVLGYRWVALCLVLASLAVAIVTALADMTRRSQVQPWAAGAVATVIVLAILPAAAVSSRLLEPQKVWPAGTWSGSDGSSGPRLASAPLVPDPPRAASPTPTRAPAPVPTPTPTPSVIARRACAPSDLTLLVGGFDFGLGRRTASLTASNASASACYLDGFATVTLLQGGKVIDLKIGTTSSDMPGLGSDGHATRVGLRHGDRARAALFWLGYGAAADTKTPQTLNILLRPGVASVSLTVPPPRFELIDGGELRVGNWLPSP